MEVMMRALTVALASMAILLSVRVTADEFLIGPWRLGMSKNEVTAFARYQPYASIAAKHGVETANGTFLGEARRIAFMFDDDGLAYIQAWEYEGDDFEAAGNGVLRIFDVFEKQFGGATIDGVDLKEGNQATKLDRAVLKLLIAQTLGTAEERGDAAKRDQGASMTMVFDMRPAQQPDGSRLDAQWGYTSRDRTYFVCLYQDRPSNPERRTESIISLQKQ
jgi:hypothetical protein